MATYVIVNSAGSPLSGYYPNEVKGSQLAYRRGDYYIFSTKSEAEDMVKRIQRKGIGRNLSVRRR